MRLTYLLYGIYGIFGLLQRWKEIMLRELNKTFIVYKCIIRETLKDVSIEDFFYWIDFLGTLDYLWQTCSNTTPPITSEQIRIVSMRVAYRKWKLFLLRFRKLLKTRRNYIITTNHRNVWNSLSNWKEAAQSLRPHWPQFFRIILLRTILNSSESCSTPVCTILELLLCIDWF